MSLNSSNSPATQETLEALNNKFSALGQNSSANSVPVSLGYDQLINSVTFFRNTALTNTAVAVKVSSGQLRGWNIINTGNQNAFVKFYNIASGSVTVGTSAVSKTIFVPAHGGVFLEAGFFSHFNFTIAISIAGTRNLADSDNTAPSTALYIEIFYT